MKFRQIFHFVTYSLDNFKDCDMAIDINIETNLMDMFTNILCYTMKIIRADEQTLLKTLLSGKM